MGVVGVVGAFRPAWGYPQREAKRSRYLPHGELGFDPEQINGTPGKAVGCPHSLAEPRKPA